MTPALLKNGFAKQPVNPLYLNPTKNLGVISKEHAENDFLDLPNKEGFSIAFSSDRWNFGGIIKQVTNA